MSSAFILPIFSDAQAVRAAYHPPHQINAIELGRIEVEFGVHRPAPV